MKTHQTHELKELEAHPNCRQRVDQLPAVPWTTLVRNSQHRIEHRVACGSAVLAEESTDGRKQLSEVENAMSKLLHNKRDIEGLMKPRYVRWVKGGKAPRPENVVRRLAGKCARPDRNWRRRWEHDGQDNFPQLFNKRRNARRHMNGQGLLTWEMIGARYEKIRVAEVRRAATDMAVHVSAFIEGDTRATGFNLGLDRAPIHIRRLALAL